MPDYPVLVLFVFIRLIDFALLKNTVKDLVIIFNLFIL